MEQKLDRRNVTDSAHAESKNGHMAKCSLTAKTSRLIGNQARITQIRGQMLNREFIGNRRRSYTFETPDNYI